MKSIQIKLKNKIMLIPIYVNLFEFMNFENFCIVNIIDSSKIMKISMNELNFSHYYLSLAVVRYFLLLKIFFVHRKVP